MPCITDTPEERTDELVTENKRLRGALCAAIRTLFDIHTGQTPATAPVAPITKLRNGHALIDLSDSGVSAMWLNDWWHLHYDQDVARKEREEQEAKRQQLRSQALAKLSDEERTALGHPPLFYTGRQPPQPPQVGEDWPRPNSHASGGRNKGMPGGDV